MPLDLSELKELLGGNSASHSFTVGTKYLIRTVTMHYTGRLTRVTDSDITLEDAAWIADTGLMSTIPTTHELNLDVSAEEARALHRVVRAIWVVSSKEQDE